MHNGHFPVNIHYKLANDSILNHFKMSFARFYYKLFILKSLQPNWHGGNPKLCVCTIVTQWKIVMFSKIDSSWDLSISVCQNLENWKLEKSLWLLWWQALPQKGSIYDEYISFYITPVFSNSWFSMILIYCKTGVWKIKVNPK